MNGRALRPHLKMRTQEMIDDQGVIFYGTLESNLVRADCGDNMSGSRRESRVKPAIAKLDDTERAI